ncbi:redoxin domain-containing protein [Helcobacillus sp. ACRRO]|uniref:redoxin domain-containing protein n=1 Tax=Helcobacillus TaxID=1161125 RepID=UPI001EF70D83|nr:MULTISPECIES: redoxin domain-containing protein [Helcobacillus]MCG7427672.1 redoxin domain-containing protein [Helcobacillus sp. ACRRO]MDK7741962.1 redoxin domain-containing protein [Helcobacillus massiliensis]WOO93127.1 redoxin domain-containing protein [Helcobacillus massiliensis]
MTDTLATPERPDAPELRGRSWLNTGGAALTLDDLRGKVVVLDFWTFCCVNCLHVLDELRPLEEEFGDVAVVVGVHSPKFEFERDPDALAANCERYDVHHPVLDDPELRTWTAYGAKAWPTLIVLDTHGRIAASMSGEGHRENLRGIIERLAAEGKSDGSLRRGPAPTVIEERELQPLRFPSKAVRLNDGRWAVSDAGQHRVVITEADGSTVSEVIGTGQRGWADGEAGEAQFAEPNGIAVLPPEVADECGYDLVVADTANHRLRGIALGHARLLRSRTASVVRSLAGTGRQWMQGEPLASFSGSPLAFSLSTPWDLQYDPVSRQVLITMAGIHQLWAYTPAVVDDNGEFGDTGAIGVIAGTTQEGSVDGPLHDSWWAQPSGITVDGSGSLFVADSETSAIRMVDHERQAVTTLAGAGLFDFGYVDGPLETARFQHPLGITVMTDGRIAVADTYNGAIRIVDPSQDSVVTIATGLNEPSDVQNADPIDGVAQLMVVESGAHRINWISAAPAAEQHIDTGAQETQRPVTDVPADGRLRVDVLFTPPEGHKLDDSYGPATKVSITTTPPEMLLSGGGDSTDLSRTIELDPSIPEGVLHVNARAASCDADPANEFPACHMHQQDWGVPIALADGAPDHLDLSLLG